MELNGVSVHVQGRLVAVGGAAPVRLTERERAVFDALQAPGWSLARELALLRAVGASRRQVAAAVLGEGLARQHYEEGVEKEQKLWGISVTTTIKEDIYDPRTAWLYTPQNFLGNFFTLQDATLFLKQEANMIEFYTYEILGMAIANRLSVQRIQFEERS